MMGTTAAIICIGQTCIHRERGSHSAILCRISRHFEYLGIVRYSIDGSFEHLNAFDLVPVDVTNTDRLAWAFLDDILGDNQIHMYLQEHEVAPDFKIVLANDAKVVVFKRGRTRNCKWLIEVDDRIVAQTSESDFFLAGDELLKQLDIGTTSESQGT